MKRFFTPIYLKTISIFQLQLILILVLFFTTVSKSQELKYGDNFNKTFSIASKMQEFTYSYPEYDNIGNGLKHIFTYLIKNECSGYGGDAIDKMLVVFWLKDDKYILSALTSNMPLSFPNSCAEPVINKKELSSLITTSLSNAEYITTMPSTDGNNIRIYKTKEGYKAYRLNYTSYRITWYIYKERSSLDIVINGLDDYQEKEAKEQKRQTIIQDEERNQQLKIQQELQEKRLKKAQEKRDSFALAFKVLQNKVRSKTYKISEFDQSFISNAQKQVLEYLKNEVPNCYLNTKCRFQIIFKVDSSGENLTDVKTECNYQLPFNIQKARTLIEIPICKTQNVLVDADEIVDGKWEITSKENFEATVTKNKVKFPRKLSLSASQKQYLNTKLGGKIPGIYRVEYVYGTVSVGSETIKIENATIHISNNNTGSEKTVGRKILNGLYIAALCAGLVFMYGWYK